ncbi:MAG: hypothetical protein LAQ30_29780 [Acidobacteriia bacterium]|nr:hypothetical protein [Terriglobia bacterium]
MKRRFALLFALVALAAASAKTYSIHLYQPAMLGNSELAAGDYKLEVDGQKAVLKNGRIDAEAPVKIETTGKKFASNTVRMEDHDGKMHIVAIGLSGTTTRLVFQP